MARVIPDNILEIILDFIGSVGALIKVNKATKSKRIKAIIEHTFTRESTCI